MLYLSIYIVVTYILILMTDCPYARKEFANCTPYTFFGESTPKCTYYSYPDLFFPFVLKMI